MRKLILLLVSILIISLLIIIKPININEKESKKQNTKIKVVSAENQYGSIAKIIGGKKVEVSSIINNADGDPHKFISSVKNAKLISDADIIIYNGADYDSWINPIIENINSKTYIVKIQDLMYYGENKKLGINPHLWFHPKTFPALATKLKDIFIAKDPKNKSLYEKNYKKFKKKYKKVYKLIKEIKIKYSGTPTTATEPVFGYMTKSLGLKNKGIKFQWVSMNGSEHSPIMMLNYQKLLKDKKVKVLFYNEQVTDNTTKNILNIAEENNIPVVGLTETMPKNKNAISWMIYCLESTQKALQKSCNQND